MWLVHVGSGRTCQCPQMESMPKTESHCLPTFCLPLNVENDVCSCDKKGRCQDSSFLHGQFIQQSKTGYEGY